MENENLSPQTSMETKISCKRDNEGYDFNDWNIKSLSFSQA